MLVTIHQPSEQTFALFDRVILLANGQVAYSGPVDKLDAYFLRLGLVRPPTIPNADFYIEALSQVHEQDREELGADKVAAKAREIEGILDTYRANSGQRRFVGEEVPFTMPSETGTTYTFASWMDEFLALYDRAAKTQVRTPQLVRVRTVQTIIIGLLVGIFFLKLGLAQSSVQNRMGLTFMMLVNTFIIATMGVLSTFPAERTVLIRDQESGMYPISAYFLAKVGIPFLSPSDSVNRTCLG